MDLFKEYRKYKLRKKCAMQNVINKSAKLEDVLTNEQIGRALAYYLRHKDILYEIIDLTNEMSKQPFKSFAPSLSEDKNNPGIWKGGHWMWFLGYLK